MFENGWRKIIDFFFNFSSFSITIRLDLYNGKQTKPILYDLRCKTNCFKYVRKFDIVLYFFLFVCLFVFFLKKENTYYSQVNSIYYLKFNDLKLVSYSLKLNGNSWVSNNFGKLFSISFKPGGDFFTNWIEILLEFFPFQFFNFLSL